MVRIYMVGGSTVDVNDTYDQMWNNIFFESVRGGWFHVIDRAGNGNALRVEHIAHIREVQI